MKRCLPICLLLLSFSAYGALTKWVDADGKVQYSDGPTPDNIKPKALTVPHDPIGDRPVAKTAVEREMEWKKTQKAKEEADKKATQKQEDALARQKNCVVAKTNLKILESNSPLLTYNDKGESIHMDDATRKNDLDEVRKQISSFCN